MARYIEIPDDGIIRYQINYGDAAVGVRIFDLSNYPTVDAVPIKHGKWIPHPAYSDWDVCTACGTGCLKRYHENGWLTEYGYAYCPHCGAKMEVTSDENT